MADSKQIMGVSMPPRGAFAPAGPPIGAQAVQGVKPVAVKPDPKKKKRIASVLAETETTY